MELETTTKTCVVRIWL